MKYHFLLKKSVLLFIKITFEEKYSTEIFWMFCLSMLHLFDLFRTKKVNIITIIVFYLNTFTVQVIILM